MTESLTHTFELDSRELISIVGAGGKTTTMHRLGAELAGAGAQVVLTTTTKVGGDQVSEPSLCSTDPGTIARAITPPHPLFVACSVTPEKATGLTTEQVDLIFAEPSIDYIVVEADGARRKLIKAPADHEPQIPSETTTVVVVAALTALGGPIVEVAHRPELVSELLGTGQDSLLTVERLAQLLTDPRGGLQNVPPAARVVVALTGTSPNARPLITMLNNHPQIDVALSIGPETLLTPPAPPL